MFHFLRLSFAFLTHKLQNRCCVSEKLSGHGAAKEEKEIEITLSPQLGNEEVWRLASEEVRMLGDEEVGVRKRGSWEVSERGSWRLGSDDFRRLGNEEVRGLRYEGVCFVTGSSEVRKRRS